MPATASTGKLFDAVGRWSGNIGSGGVADASTTTIPLSATTGLTNGNAYIVTLNRVDANGTKISPPNYEVVIGVLSGSNLTSCVRGKEGTAQAWDAGVVVEVLFTASHWDKLISHLDAEHNDDGTHSDITATSATLTGTAEANKLTVKSVDISSGWFKYSAVTPTRASADDPTYVLTFAGVDLTSILSVGMKIKLTQSTDKYFIVTAISFSTDTTLTLYGGTDYDVDDTETTAISAFYYSPHKAPLEFPLDVDKWTVEYSFNSSYVISPLITANAWYDSGMTGIIAPIGLWKASYKALVSLESNSSSYAQGRCSLSTSSGGAGNSPLVKVIYETNTAPGYVHGEDFFAEDILEFSSKTTMYVNGGRRGAQSQTAFNFHGDISPIIIRFKCAYL